MKRKFSFQSAFFNLRVLFVAVFACAGVLLVLAEIGAFPGSSARAQGPKESRGAPDVVPMVGPISQDLDLRALPYIPPSPEREEVRLRRYPPSKVPYQGKTDPVQVVRQATEPTAMPTPIATYPGITSAQCGCLPPDTHGDVGPNHYIQSVNSSIKIIDKSGNQLLAPTTYNSFFSGLASTGTPCGLNQNFGDGFVFYDHLADRWVVSDFAFPAQGSPYYQCIGVSKTSDPVAGGWWLYALQHDPANPDYLGDYPKFGLWPDAYYFSVNLTSGDGSAYYGVRVFALPRLAMINGTGAPSAGAIAFSVSLETLGASGTMVPATFRTGSLPPTGRPEYFMSIDSHQDGSTVENKVSAWRFHVDFETPANSTFGVGANHGPDGIVTVNDFVNAYQGNGTDNIVPQNGTARRLDTLGGLLMTPLVYQNRGGVESLWASHTVNNNLNGTGPTAIRWYQFDTTNNTIPATPLQQQTFNNNADGLWRWMPSIAVDGRGNMAIGFSESSAVTEPAIAYAGRLASDPANTLGQGEALMTAGGGHQTSTSGRWGDYSALSIDPSDNTFWHTNEYYSTTSTTSWNTRIGKFKFPSAPAVVSAVSRKAHNQVNFDIPLPASGSPGIECRRGSGASFDGHQVVVTFAAPVTVAGVTVTSNDGQATGTQSVAGAVVTINLSTVSNAQTITITLVNVNDGTNAGDVSIALGLLVGDTNGDRFVNAGDALQTRNRSGQAADATNFRSDVNTDGFVNSGDTLVVRSGSGAALP